MDGPRPLRSDAERNRLAIISAAEEMLAEEGTSVSLERIAKAAHVGVGTIYRRFASVEDLVGVVLEERMRRYAERTERAAEQATTEPWPAFRDWVLFATEQQAADLAFSDVVLAGGHDSAPFHAQLRRAFRASVVLVERARAAGAIRPDFRHDDLLLLQHATAGVVRHLDRSADDSSRRLADYLLDAFRAGPADRDPRVDSRTTNSGSNTM